MNCFTGQCPRSAFECLLQQKPQILSADLGDPWRRLVERALPLQKELRPNSVRTWWETRWDNLPPFKPVPFPRPAFPLPEPDPSANQAGVLRPPLMEFQPIPLVESEAPAPAARQRFADATPHPVTDASPSGTGNKTLSPIPVVVNSLPEFPALKNRQPAGPRREVLLIALLILVGLVLLLLLLLALVH